MKKHSSKTPSSADRASLIEAAQGKIDSDLLVRNVQYLDVFSCQFRKGDIAIKNGLIVGLEPGLSAKREIDAAGKWLVPGFIDAHVHVESSMMLPTDFERSVLQKGTTSAVCDTHELSNVLGLEGLKYFLESADQLQMDLWVMLSSCVPATHLETNGGGELSAEDLLSVADHPRALGLAEMMNMPGVLHADPNVLAKLQAFENRPKDGHCPLLRGAELSAYAAAGISSCHESSELDEAAEKLQKGISVWIREGSVAKDLDRLIPLLTLATSTSIGFCTDDRNPLDIELEGHVDYLVRSAIQKGVAYEVAYRAASWSVARHYGLDQGFKRTGAIAPGYRADLVLLEDAETCAIQSVLKAGQAISELPESPRVQAEISNTVQATAPEASLLEGPAGRVHVITVEHGKILTGREVAQSTDEGVSRLSVLERYGHGHPPANAYVRGFGSLRGAIASSVGHDSHNLIVVGEKTEDMRTALAALIETGGGFSVVQNKKVIGHLPLPFGGLMSQLNPKELSQEIRQLKEASRSIGCILPEPFLQLAFLSLPVIPSLKLTDRGLVDVEKFEFISPLAS